VPIRIRVQGRRADGSHTSGGLIAIKRIWDSPHWFGPRAGGFEEIVFSLSGTWYLFRHALEPKLECFSVEDEREELKDYVDESSSIIQLSANEANLWFAKSGFEIPANGPEPKSPKKRGRRRGSVTTDPTKDAKLYDDWKATQTTIADFSYRRRLPFEDVDAAIKRHKRRLYERKKNSQ
jgi:hypothetical protein